MHIFRTIFALVTCFVLASCGTPVCFMGFGQCDSFQSNSNKTLGSGGSDSSSGTSGFQSTDGKLRVTVEPPILTLLKDKDDVTLRATGSSSSFSFSKIETGSRGEYQVIETGEKSLRIRGTEKGEIHIHVQENNAVTDGEKRSVVVVLVVYEE